MSTPIASCNKPSPGVIASPVVGFITSEHDFDIEEIWCHKESFFFFC
ncbi:hypothetical protein IC582_014916 [Cucumis melo]